MDRYERLKTLLRDRSCDAIVLTKPANIAAFFNGTQASLGFRQEPPGRIAVCVTESETVLLGNRTEVTRMVHDEPFEPPDLKTDAVQWDAWRLDTSVQDYLRAQRYGRICDDSGAFGEDIGASLESMYYPLSESEERTIRDIAQDAAGILELVAKSVKQGSTEARVAGDLTGRLVAAGILPEFVMVATDERIRTLRHCMPKDVPVRRVMLLSATVHRRGLYSSLTRIVSLGRAPKEWARLQAACNHIDATAISLSVAGKPIGDVFRSLVASYVAQGHAEEWRFHHQGGPAGFSGRDYKATDGEKRCLVERQPIVWNPTVRGAKSEDTILTSEDGKAPAILTHTGNWDYSEIPTEAGPIMRPAILAL